MPGRDARCELGAVSDVHSYGEQVAWQPDEPEFSIVRLVLGWIVAAAAVAVSVWIVPGTDIDRPSAAFVVAAFIGVVNAVLPPILAAIRLPFMLVTGFLLVLVADALALVIAGEVLPATSTSVTSATPFWPRC